MALKNLGVSTSGNKSLKGLAPNPKSSKQITGGDAGPGGSIRTGKVYKAPSSNLASGTSAHRGNGMGSTTYGR